MANRCTNNLLLDELAYGKLNEFDRSMFVLEWLNYLSEALIVTDQKKVKECQKELTEQLFKQLLASNSGPPTRHLLGKCLATLFSVGDTFLVFETVNKCNEILKNKDDSPSFLPTKLSAVSALGIMYEKLGRLMGRSYEETILLMLKSLKNAESQLRCAIYQALRLTIKGMGSAANALYRDLFKSVRVGMTDRVFGVRINSVGVLQEMLKHFSTIYTTDLEHTFSLVYRAVDGSNFELRLALGRLLGALAAQTQRPSSAVFGKTRLSSLEEILSLLGNGFLRGGMSFLKSGPTEMIKGTSGPNRETRLCLTYAYIELASNLGSNWLEKHLRTFLNHVLDLLGSPKTASTHTDAVYSRRCVGFILRSVFARLLSEKAQVEAIKELVLVINKYARHNTANSSSLANVSNLNMQSSSSLKTESSELSSTVKVDLNSQSTNTMTLLSSKENSVVDANLVQYILMASLLEVGILIENLGTSSASLLSESNLAVTDTIESLLTHPSNGVRLVAAWSLRCIVIGCPSQLTPLIERNLERLETLKSSVETISGRSVAISSLLAAASQTVLGLPQNKGKLVFNIGEDLLRSSTSLNSRFIPQRTQAGWQLIAGVMTLGPSSVNRLLPRLLLLWKNCFPRSVKELNSESTRGDAFTWQITLDNRAGALAAMSCFLTSCPTLVTDDVIKRILVPASSAISMLSNLNSFFKSSGPSVKASAALVRLRLYDTLLQLPAHLYDEYHTSLLRLIVSEFTLADNSLNIVTTVLKGFCLPNQALVIGCSVQEKDYQIIEDELSFSNLFGCGSIEQDVTCVYKRLTSDEMHPCPFPLGVSVVDKSCLLFAQMYRYVAIKHRLQIILHVQECIKLSKGPRQEAVQLNCLAALLGALKSLMENKSSIGSDEIHKQLNLLLSSMLASSNPLIRCAAAQAYGRLAQVVGEIKSVSEKALFCFDKLRSSRDALTRTGHSLALGYLHRFFGSLGSSQNLNTCISLLLALAQDSTSSVVQIWALQSLSLIMDSEGPMFRTYIEPSLKQSFKVLVSSPDMSADLHQSIGKLTSSIITMLGPELQTDSNDMLSSMRNLTILSSNLLLMHLDPLVRSEAFFCFQQLHLFAPKYIDIMRLSEAIFSDITNPSIYLRRAIISCLHQLCQSEAQLVCENVKKWFRNSLKSDSNLVYHYNDYLNQYGLPGLLFALLDWEQDEPMIADIQKVLLSLVQNLGTQQLHDWLSLIKSVLTFSDSNSVDSSPEKEADNENTFEDDEVSFKASEQHLVSYMMPRWKTRVFAAQCLKKLITLCATCSDAKVHFDLILARDEKAKHLQKDFLVLHLSDLIRMAFMASTSDCDVLRLEGLLTLQMIIDKYSTVQEPEFPDHVVLEQYQAQVGAALRPAFSPDTPSHVTAIACQVCSAWIGSGVARDLNDLRRVHQLLVSSLTKLQKDSCSHLYNESASTLEKLSILRAWAEVYIVAMEREDQLGKMSASLCLSSNKARSNVVSEENLSYVSQNGSLLELVKPELKSLSEYWLSALKDHAMLILPEEFASQLPHDGGTFYIPDTIEATRPQYRDSWPSMLRAVALWLCSEGFDEEANEHAVKSTESLSGQGNEDRFYLLLGICVEALCNPEGSESLSRVSTCLKSLEALLMHSASRRMASTDSQLCIELCNVLHRLLLTRESPENQETILHIVHLVYLACFESLALQRKEAAERLSASSSQSVNEQLDQLGEGSSDGVLIPGQSVVYSLLEISLCILVRHLPRLSPQLANTPGMASVCSNVVKIELNSSASVCIGHTIALLVETVQLCSPMGALTVMPTVLHLLTGVLQEIWCINMKDTNEDYCISIILKGFQSVFDFKSIDNEICDQKWIQLLQSAYAKVLDLIKSSEEPKANEKAVLQVIFTFLLKAPLKVIQVPSLQYPCINLLKQKLESGDTIVRLQSVKLLKELFEHDDVARKMPYIQSLAPRLIQSLDELVCQYISCSKISETDLTTISLGFDCFRILLNLADSDKKFNLLSFYLPMLVSLLSDNVAETRSNAGKRQIHAYALKTLTSVGQVYTTEFRQIIGGVPSLRLKLESAVRSQNDSLQSLNSQRRLSSTQSSNENRGLNANTIKLKTNFSNFSS